MGNSPSNQSPLISESMNSHLISQPRPLSSQGTAQSTRRSTSARRTPTSAHIQDDTLPAPPPYTPVAGPRELIPPVPPRDLRRASSTTVPAVSPPRPHRRTLSHSHSSHPLPPEPTPGATLVDGRAPGDGVGGFLSPHTAGSNSTQASSIIVRSPEESATRTNSTARAAPLLQPTYGRVTERARSSHINTERRQDITATRSPTRRKSKENALDSLGKFDIVIIVDDSSSMEGPLWYEARDALAGIAEEAARYNATGIDLHFLNDRTVGTKLKSARDVSRLFNSVTPCGITPTGEKLEELLLDYLLRLESAVEEKPKPVNFVILTDGAPTDDPESVIVTAAKRLDAQHAPNAQVGIQFVQLGSDPEATEALKEMDDELASRHSIRDMVDTTLYTGQSLTTELLGKILLGGVNRRIDKKGI